MRLIKKLLKWLLGVLASVVALVIALQTYYHFTPVALSAEAVALNAEAEKFTWTTENGYRLNGVLAPRNADPVAYGRCLVDVAVAHDSQVRMDVKSMPSSEDKDVNSAYWKSVSQRLDALKVGCLEGGTPLQLPTLLAQPSTIKLSITDEQWRDIHNVSLDPALLKRAELVWLGDARTLGGRIESPFPSPGVLMSISRWRVARARTLWLQGDRAAAVAAWQQTINDWLKSSDDTLIDAMLSTAALSQTLIAVQQTAARAERLDDVVASSMIMMLAPIESMTDAVSKSLLAEWHSVSMMIVDTAAVTRGSLSAHGAEGWLSFMTLEVNDSLNRSAQTHQLAVESIGVAARGQATKKNQHQGLTPDCEWLGSNDFLCIPFLRNPVGRVLAGIAVPSYDVYGTRVADLRNFTAVTRLTIEARRRGLTGDALAQFVANAPADMRDVFSGQAFIYDAMTKRLRVELRTKSNVLGDAGSYEVML